MDELKKNIIEEMTDVDFYATVHEAEKVDVTDYTRLPLTEIYALGSTFRPVFTAVYNVASKKMTKNLFQVTIPGGAHLAQFKDGSGMLGTLLGDDNRIMGQARLTPADSAGAILNCNPYMMMTAAALVTISRKLDKISETQEKILDFIEEKEKAELAGNLNTLSDILNNYKYNWGNERYINNNHIKVLDIKQKSGQNIEFYKKQARGVFDSNFTLFHMNKDVNAKKRELLAILGDYQFSVYLYAFSSYVEVLLLGNFEHNYIGRVIDRINYCTKEYIEVFEECSEKMDSFFSGAVETIAKKKAAQAAKGLGTFARKMQFLKDNKVDKGLMNAGDRLESFNNDKMIAVAENLSERKSVDVDPFISNLLHIDKMYNEDVDIYFDDEYIYISN